MLCFPYLVDWNDSLHEAYIDHCNDVEVKQSKARRVLYRARMYQTHFFGSCIAY